MLKMYSRPRITLILCLSIAIKVICLNLLKKEKKSPRKKPKNISYKSLKDFW